MTNITWAMETLFDQLLPFETPLTPIVPLSWQRTPRQS